MIDRSAVFKDAWRRYRDSQRLGFDWTFGRCLMVAWQAAKMSQRNPRHRYNPDRNYREIPGSSIIPYAFGEAA
jgi:hypothetical protein